MPRFTSKYAYYLIFVLTGFTAIGSQILFVREFFSLFSGNELFLGVYFAVWLFWTGAGSTLAGRHLPVTRSPRLPVAWLQILLAVIIPVTLLATRLSFHFWRPVVGEEIGFVQTLATLVVMLAPFCLISGALFPAGNRLLKAQAALPWAESSARVYLTETAASALGGFILSVAIITAVPIYAIALGMSLLNLLSAYLLLKSQPRAKFLPVVAAGLLLISVGLWGKYYLPYPAFRTLDVIESRYGRLEVLSQAENVFMVENGRLSFSRLEKQHAESIVHPAMLLARRPQAVLMIGGAFNGSIKEALKYPAVERLDYVELDPAILRIGRKYFPKIWRAMTGDKRVHIHRTDGRLFLARIGEKYDVIIVDLPDPLSAQLNRFYTTEFFRLVAAHLSARGVFAFSITGSENYLNPPMARFVACERNSLRAVFHDVRFIPGDPIYFFAAQHSLADDFNPIWLTDRLMEQHIATVYMRPAFLRFRLMPERLNDFNRTLRAQSDVPLNRDLHPQAYYFNLALQSSRHSVLLLRIFNLLYALPFPLWLDGLFVALIALLLIAHFSLGQTKSWRMLGGLSVFSMGFSVMAVNLMVLILYQTYYGSLYFQIAALTAACMLGMAAGSWLAMAVKWKLSAVMQVFWLHVLAGVIPLLLVWVMPRMMSEVLLFAAAFIAGVVAGGVFPVAGRLFYWKVLSESHSGSLYGLDLFGAVIGSLLVTTLFIPVYGFPNLALLLAGVNLMVLVIAGSLKLRSRYPHTL